MDRRTLLARFGAVLGTASLGGCLSQYEDIAGDAGETTTDGTETAEPTTERATTAIQRPKLADSSFELLDGGCGRPTDEASVTFESDGGTVSVEGTISGSNACYVAKLADASYDSETGTFDVTVVSMQKEGAEACAQCIVELDYEATFTFEGGLPAEVRVRHRAMGETETVATGKPA
jgi:hypothetical protein